MYQKGKLDKTADLVYKEGMKTVLAKVGLWTVSIVCFALLGAFVYINVIGFFEDEEVSAESECKKACEHCWQEDPRGTGWFDCEVDDVCYEDCVSHWPDWPVVGGYNLPTPIPTPSPIPSGDEKQGESTCPPCPEEGGDFYGYWTWECVEQCESLQTHIEDMFDLWNFLDFSNPPIQENRMALTVVAGMLVANIVGTG